MAPLVAGILQKTGVPRDVKNPYNGAVIATVDDATPELVAHAISTAEQGAHAMAAMPAHRRASILEGAAAGLEAQADEAAAILTLESGKPAREARIEVSRCVATLKFSAAAARNIHVTIPPLDGASSGDGRTAISRRVPLGIITAISPFNFPLNLPAHKVGPALAAGNSVLLKPAPRTPLSAFLLADVLLKAGCPPEAIAVIPGDPPAVDALVDDPRIAMISFTGSAAVGWNLKQRAGRKKIALELGGNAAAVVHEDAHLGLAVGRCLVGSFTFAGQVCIRSQRILLHKSNAEEFTKQFVQKAAALRRGDPVSMDTEIGPMIDCASAARAYSWIDEARSQGAEVLLGGPPDGAFLPPTILRNVPSSCRAYGEEIFAPVVVLETYEHFDAALTRVNHGRYGLQTGIFTNRWDLLARAFDQLQVGAVIHNDSPMFRMDAMPYGGVKDSGFGREGPAFAIEEMTEIRLLVLRDGRGGK